MEYLTSLFRWSNQQGSLQDASSEGDDTLEPCILPDDFLTSPLPGPISVHRIDWSDTALPELGNRYATILDNVLTREECVQLLDLAQQQHPWKPAMVSIGPGRDVLETEHRNSDRLIWNHQEVADRIWARIATAGDVAQDLKTADWTGVQDFPGCEWRFTKLDGRMKFLKYAKGQFFRPHNDSSSTQSVDGRMFKPHFTVHLYLTDSVSASPAADAEPLSGGATVFLSADDGRQVEVAPRAGRVLIFQHRRMRHAGSDVLAGTKYTMRADVWYELVDAATGESKNPFA